MELMRLLNKEKGLLFSDTMLGVKEVVFHRGRDLAYINWSESILNKNLRTGEQFTNVYYE